MICYLTAWLMSNHSSVPYLVLFPYFYQTAQNLSGLDPDSSS